MLLLVRYDGEDEAVDEAWPSEDLEVLEPDALPPKKRGRKEPKPAVEPAAVEPATEPPKLSLAEMATAAARAARQEAAAAAPEDSDSSDDEPIGMVAGPRVQTSLSSRRTDALAAQGRRELKSKPAAKPDPFH